MKSLIRVLSFLTVLIATPAFADEPYAVTPSGATEAYFDMEVVEASDYLGNQCLDLGWTMVNSTDTTVVCEVPMSFGSRLLSALASPSYSTPPRQYFRFNLAGSQGFARVQATAWQETQTAFGQNRRTDLESNNYHNTVMAFFQSIGGIFPPNTSFPNHANMGVDYEYVETPSDGMVIRGFREGSAFEAAGLQIGDVVTRLAGKRIKDENDLSDGLHDAIESGTYEVQFFRNGERMELSVAREFRATMGPLPEREVGVPDVAIDTSPSIMQQQFSVAEELARFAALLEQGVITQEEFDTQKARLLLGE